MLNIEKFVTMSPEQWEIVIEGMRNPKNSWGKIDSWTTTVVDCETNRVVPAEFFVGPKDQKLMMELKAGGPVHAKYLRMMPVWVTLTAPLYWWKEFDTYKVGTVANSCSTMHKIHAKEFTLEDFSCENLSDITHPGAAFIYPCIIRDNANINEWIKYECVAAPMEALKLTIDVLNTYRYRFIKTEKKRYWDQLIQLLPSSYNQKRTVFLNYEVLSNIYKWRRNHKLDEWHVFCDWIESLPYPELITGEVKHEQEVN